MLAEDSRNLNFLLNIGGLAFTGQCYRRKLIVIVDSLWHSFALEEMLMGVVDKLQLLLVLLGSGHQKGKGDDKLLRGVFFPGRQRRLR